MGLRKFTQTYARHIPQIVILQLITKSLIGVVIILLSALSNWAFASQGRVAISSGDFAFVFLCWQGWVLILATIVLLYVSFALDVNAQVAFSGYAVRGEEVSIRRLLQEGLSAIRLFLHLDGLAVVLYSVLLVPIVGVGLGVSLTEGLKIPSFISAVIEATPLYNTAYTIVLTILLIVGLRFIFTIHGVMLDHLTVSQAMRQSAQIMRTNWRDYIVKMIRFALATALVVVAVVVLAILALAIAPAMLFDQLELSLLFERFCNIMLVLVGIGIARFASFPVGSFVIMKMTQLYLNYTRDEPVEIPVARPRYLKPLAVGALVMLAVTLTVSAVMALYFDRVFPDECNVRIIAHRAGGTEGPENTVAGLMAGAEAGAWGAEIDIQRTADGAYVVNHDANFKRVAGVDRKPEEMTLAEVRTLRVDGEPIATYEEMLEAARDRVVLFVELKGATADQQMADDAVRIAREAGMLDQVVFISLDYQLIDYLAKTYPDVAEAYLAFACFGDTAALNCEDIAFEELSCTASAIGNAQAQNKRVFVWTANSRESQHHFLCTEVDAIITDNVTQAVQEREALAKRSDLRRMLDAIEL